MKRKVGRPSKYNEKIAAEICAGIAQGRSLRSICADEEMPVLSTVMLWLRHHREFSEQYDRSRLDRCDAFAEEILEISDDASEDYIEGERGTVGNSAAVNRSKLRVDTRKWLMSRMLPKKYGDKVEQTLRGDSEAPVVVELVAAGPDDVVPEGDDEEREGEDGTTA
jgi:hypothetical protein